MGKLEKMLGQIVVKQRWWIIVATALIVAVAASGMRLLTFNNDSVVKSPIYCACPPRAGCSIFIPPRFGGGI